MALTQFEETIVRSIAPRQGELVDQLAKLVAIPTGGGNKAGLDACRAVLCDRLRALGASVSMVPGDAKPDWLSGGDVGGENGPTTIPATAVCASESTAKAPRVLLCGHLDTVHNPRGAFQRLDMSSDGARGVGPGCMDMKGGILVAIAALEALTAAGVRFPWTFVLNSDEETGSFHSDRAIREQAAKHDVGLVFEPALPDGGLVVERPGSGQFVIHARGKAAHVGRDFKAGVNAIYAVAERSLACARLADPDRGKIVTIGVIKGGRATNIVPDEAAAWGNVRFGSPEVEAELARELDAMGDSAGLSTIPARPSVEVLRTFSRPAKPLTPEVQALANLARQTAQDLGQTLPFGKTGGVCDGNNIQAAGGRSIPVIDTLGVKGGGAHTGEEWIELTSLMERAQLAAVLMSRIAQGQLSA
ncbi:MAG: M20/M25/M40 family metallo-hydrolase [Planctomycetota bacterium]